MKRKELSPQYVIVVGLGGCGKTHAAECLANEWTALNHRRTIITEEPTRKNRNEIFATAAQPGVLPMTIVRMFYDDRRILINDLVRPSLALGENVISIRGYPCTHAYEGPLGATSEEMYAEHLRQLGLQGADLIYYLRLTDPQKGLLRKNGKLDGDTFDMKKHDYHLAVMAEYDLMAERYGVSNSFADPVFGRWVTIDADQSIPEVQRQLCDSTRELVKLQC